MIETLSAIFGSMLDCARSYDGTLLKFGGDALLFLFRGPQHELRAASAAVEMRRVLRTAADMPTSVGKLKLSMSVGLHGGELLFILAGDRHRELVLAGRDASRATEIEGAAGAGQIAVSDATAAALPAKGLRERDDGLKLVRWRKAPLEPTGHSPVPRASREILHNLFPEILHATLEDAPPEPEHRVACIAFVRFSGTDRLLAEQGPEALADALHSTVSTAEEIFVAENISLLAVDIDRDGGKLFLGSGVPKATEDDEGSMLRALRKLADAQTPLQLQCGVNRGHVFVAEVGTPWRAAYSAMGDTTNTAARICAKAPPGAIYAHPSVLAWSRTEFETEQVGPFTFKGKKAAQDLYCVGDEIGLRQDVMRGTTAMVGRKNELNQLNSAIDDLDQGRGNVITITGASGIGKSKLIHHMQSPEESTETLRLRAEPNGMTSLYSMLRDPLRGILGIDPKLSPPPAQQLEEAVTRLAPQLTPMLALIGDVVQIEVPPSPEVESIETAYRAERTAETVHQLLGAVFSGRLLLIAEDAHWSDEASALILDRLSNLCSKEPWLMIVSRRDIEGGFRPEVGSIVQLQPLSGKQIEKLIVTATTAAPLRPHEVKLVARRAGGNPLFAEEIVRAARSIGSVEAVPESVEAVMAAQIDTLDKAARRVLRYATVLGRRFEQTTLAAVLESEGYELDAAMLSRLNGFLEPIDDGKLAFRNGLIRKTIYEGLAYRVRRRLHKVAGETIERLADDPYELAGDLATHYSIAEDARRTWDYGMAAAARASDAWANVEAAQMYQLAADAARRLRDIGDPVRAQLWISMGTVRDRAGMFDEALDAYKRAGKFVKDDPVARAPDMFSARLRQRPGGSFPGCAA